MNASSHDGVVEWSSGVGRWLRVEVEKGEMRWCMRDEDDNNNERTLTFGFVSVFWKFLQEWEMKRGP